MALAALLAVTLLQAAEPTPVSPATVTAPKPAATAAKGAGNPNEVTCKKDEVTTGSMFVKRICHTRAEWDAIAQASKDKVNDMQTGHVVFQPQGGR
jgi:hypothetical protein